MHSNGKDINILIGKFFISFLIWNRIGCEPSFSLNRSKIFKSWKSPIVFETVVANLNQLHSLKSKPTDKIVEVLSNDIIRIEGQPICKGDDQTGKPFYGVIKRNNDGDSRTASKLYCSSLDSPLLCQSSYHFLAIGMGFWYVSKLPESSSTVDSWTNPITETIPTSLPYQVKLVDFKIAANKTRLYASRIFNFCSVDGINGNPGILSAINRDTAACKVLGVEYFQNLKKPELTNANIKILIEEKTDKRKDPAIVPVTETAVVKVIEETALFELKALLIG